MNNLVDTQRLWEHFDYDRDFLEETFDVFGRESQNLLSALSAALDEGNPAVAGELAHTLKGMLGNFLAEAACATAAEMEHASRSRSLAELQALSQMLARQIEQVQSEVKNALGI